MVWATPVQNLGQIAETVREFILQQYPKQNLKKEDIKISGLDRRLRLAHCKKPLQASLGPGNLPHNIRTVEINCYGKKPWTLYVPVKISRKVQVLRLKNNLARHQIVKARDVELTTIKQSGNVLSGAFSNIEQIKGYRTKYPLMAGSVLQANNLLPPVLVKRGQMVVILYKNPSLSIRMSGTALMNGEAGAIISVQNAKSKRIISAKVIAEGIVAVGP